MTPGSVKNHKIIGVRGVLKEVIKTGALLCLLVGELCGGIGQSYAQSNTAPPIVSRSIAPLAILPTDISPEGVLGLIQQGMPFILVDAENSTASAPRAGHDVRTIYYTRGPSGRAAHDQVMRERNAHPSTSSDADVPMSQRLTGTPAEWVRLGLPFSVPPQPMQPLLVSPVALAQSIKDGVDLQLIDVRASTDAAFPQALRLMPHELEAAPAALSKRRWTILIDNGDRAAQPLAERLFAQGYSLVAVLDGGYPAWVQTTDK